MPKEIDWDNPHTSQKYIDQLGLNLGVSRDDFYEEDMGSQGNFDSKGYAEAVERAYANDYSTRRALEAANLAGEDVPENIGSMEDAYTAHNWMKDQHEGGGKYSSDADRANITTKWVNKDREKFTSDLEDSFSDYIEENQEEAADDQNQQAEGIQYSDELQAAYSRVNENERNIQNSSNDIYGFDPTKALENSTINVSDAKPYGKGEDQRQNTASEFLRNFKVDLMSGLRDNPFGSTTTEAPARHYY